MMDLLIDALLAGDRARSAAEAERLRDAGVGEGRIITGAVEAVMGFLEGEAAEPLAPEMVARCRRAVSAVFNVLHPSDVSPLRTREPLQGGAQGERNKRHQEALRESEERFRLAGKVAYDLIYEWDVSNDSLEWFGDVDGLLGYGPGEISRDIGAWLALIHPEDRGQLQDAVELHRTSTEPIRYQYRIRHRDGVYRHWNDHALPLLDDRDRPYRWIGVCTDITVRKQAEEESRRALEMLYDSQRAAHIGTWWLDLSDGTVNWTTEVFRIFGLQPGQVAPPLEEFLRFVHPDDRAHVRIKAREQMERFEGSMKYVYGIQRSDGEVRSLEHIGRQVLNAEGDPVRIIGTVQDITERKADEAEREKLQDQLLQAQKLESVGRLAGGIAHDFNNMLGVILGHAEMAALSVEPDDPVHGNLSEIQKAGRRSADLTRQLLAFARKQTIAPRVLDLNETLEGMLKMLRRLIGEDLGLVWNPGAKLWPVRIDPAQVDQVLANLCVNARDAISGPGKIVIRTENMILDQYFPADRADFVPGEYVLLAVNDDGCGMDGETLKKVFDPFFTTKELGKGTGLGLATVYGIVRQNDGIIHVYSEPGQGTTFNIYLPRREKGDAPAKPADTAEMLRGNGETVLMVEDDPGMLSMGIAMLEELGYSVLPANGPEEAEKLARTHPGEIRLLLTDVVMPRMSGKDLAERIQAILPRVGVLFMSGYPAESIAHHGILEEGVLFIEKPFSMTAIAARMSDALEK